MSKTAAVDWLLGPRSVIRNISSNLHQTKTVRTLCGIFFIFFIVCIFAFLSSTSKVIFFFSTNPDFAKIFLNVSSGIAVLIVLPAISLLSHLQRRRRFIDFDLAFSIILAFVFSALYFLDDLNPIAAITLPGLGVLLLALRFFETKLWSAFSNLEAPSWSSDEFAHSLSEFSNKNLLFSRLIAAMIFIVLLAVCFSKSGATEEILILIPSTLAFFLPVSAWIQARLFLWMIKAKAKINHLSLLLEISTRGFLRFHFWGVFRKPLIEEIDIFQDPSSAWEEIELLSLIKTLGEFSIHPGGQALSRRLSSLQPLELAGENLDYIGLQCSFRCPDGLLHPSIMSHYHWLKAHDHEFSPEMEHWYREALNENKMVSFLSIDKRVVLALSLQSQEAETLNKTFFDLKKLGYRLGLWTSVPPSYFERYQESLDDCASKLIPVERTVQAAHWNERASSAISVYSYWDPPEFSGPRVIFQEEPRLEIQNEELHFHQQDISALVRIIEETRGFSQSMKLSILIPSLWVLVLFFIGLEFGLLMGLFCSLLSLLVLIIYFNPHFKKEMI